MRVLITGSNGLLGQKLVTLLSNRPSTEIIATSLGSNRLRTSKSYHYESLDITNPSDLKGFLRNYKPETVIHTAAMTQVDECQAHKEACWHLNVEAVEVLAKECEAQDIFLAHLSTDFIFDGIEGPYLETDAPNPLNFYGWSKLAAERKIMRSSGQWAIVRTALVFGVAPNMSRSNIILWAKDNLENRRPIRVVTDQWRTATLVEDLAKGCTLIVEKRACGIFNISGLDFLTPYEMALKTGKLLGLDTQLITPVTAANFKEQGERPPKTGLVIDKARQELGFNPTPFEEGLRLVLSQANDKNT